MAFTLPQLIERLKSADGPDRTIDADLHQYLHPDQVESTNPPYMPGYVGIKGNPHWQEIQERYTGSIDDALALMPDTYWLQIETSGISPGPNNRLWPVVRYGVASKEQTAQTKTIPVAICIAALNARAQIAKAAKAA
jgi:hypothetical protein